jgi:hypothetical protein
MPLQGFEPLTLWLLTNHGTDDAKQPLDWDTQNADEGLTDNQNFE